MQRFLHFTAFSVVWIGLCSFAAAQPAPAKPQPDARFGNTLFKTPDPKVWTRSEENGALRFSVREPAGDFCVLTVFPDTPAQGDFTDQFNQAVAADQKQRDTVTIEADSGAKPSTAAEGYPVLTRSLRSVTTAFHTYHLYVAGLNQGHFDLVAFQTSSESSWKQHGAEASRFLQSLKLASSLPADEVARLSGVATAPPPSLPGFDDALTVGAPVEAAPMATAATMPPAVSAVPDRPLERSELVVNGAVAHKNGKPIDGVKLSEHDIEVYCPSITVGPSGGIHVAFVEKHRTTYALAVYYRSSSDNGKTWTEAKNLSEDMPGYQVGKCFVLADGQGRIYVTWRAGMAVNFPASPNTGGAGPSNLMYRVLENGRWSKIIPVFPPGDSNSQDTGSLSYFAATDAAGHVQVVWNVLPNHWHPELTKISGTYHQTLAGIAAGLVFQVTLNGASPTTPKEIFLSAVGGKDLAGGWGLYCDGLDALNGYVDAAGSPHFLAAITHSHDESIAHKSVYELIEDGRTGPRVELPELSYHGWNDVPTLVVDAEGKRHALALYPAGERPSIRDYLLGSQEEPVIIRAAASIKGEVNGFQAFQGPGGKMVAIMEMNDTGDRASGETYISVSKGGGQWSKPINVTNNAGRKSFAATIRPNSLSASMEKSYYPGPATGTYDRDGHLLLLMINNEHSLFGTSALGVTMSSGSTSTPTLQFLRF